MFNGKVLQKFFRTNPSPLRKQPLKMKRAGMHCSCNGFQFRLLLRMFAYKFNRFGYFIVIGIHNSVLENKLTHSSRKIKPGTCYNTYMLLCVHLTEFFVACLIL